MKSKYWKMKDLSTKLTAVEVPVVAPGGRSRVVCFMCFSCMFNVCGMKETLCCIVTSRMYLKPTVVKFVLEL